jgi:CRP-like cAMP-binding protein
MTDPNSSFQMLIDNVSKYVTLSEEDKDQLKNSFTIKSFLRKQFLLQQGDICKHENFVSKGSFRSFYVDKEGNEHTLHFAIEDYWITDLASLLDDTPSAVYIEALEKSEVLQIEKKNLDSLLSGNPIFERFFRILHQRAYIAQNNRILDSIGLEAKERYVKFAKKFPRLVERVPQKYIASYLGMTPVFLSQIQRTLPEN